MIEEILRVLPVHIRKEVHDALRELQDVEEIRIRAQRPLVFCTGTGEYFMTPAGELTRDCGRAYAVPLSDVREMLVFMSKYSMYAFEEEIKNGFLTLTGGHRVGLGGQVLYEGGSVRTMRDIVSLNIRISHEKKGCGEKWAGLLYRAGANQTGIYHTLLLSAPGMGKTTLLRDLVRLFSDGCSGHAGLKVSVVDERSEIAGCCRGVPQNDVGLRTDVLDGCPKALGMAWMLRTMSPQVLAVDELGGEEDVRAVCNAMYCGCSILGTAHAADMEELLENPGLCGFVKNRCFERFLVIGRTDGKRSCRLYDGGGRLLC